MFDKYMLSAFMLLLSSTVLAGDNTSGEGALSLQDMDINGDGSLTPEEASTNDEIMSNWNSLDTDQDGLMSESEFSSFMETQPDAGKSRSITEEQTPGDGSLSLQGLDMNGDGSLTPEEASTNDEIMSNWNSLDTDQDGLMSESEFSSFMETQPDESKSRSAADDQTPGDGSLSLQGLDINRDGSLTPEEASTNDEIMSNWNSLDINNDGVMSEIEFAAFEKARSGEGKDRSSPGDKSIPADRME